MLIIPLDFMTQQIRLQVPGDMAHWGRITARVDVTQPCGYARSHTCPVTLDGRHGLIELRYPLMDDGAWGQVSGFCKAFDFEMGVYRFDVQLLSGGQPIARETGELDQDQLYPNSFKCRIRDDFPQGFIECAPRRPVCIDHDRVPVCIRLKTERVPRCRVRMDVCALRGDAVLAGPVEMDLDARFRDVTFDHRGWARGEYWVRVQVIEKGAGVGPYMVRRFWKEVIGPEPRPEPPLRLGSGLQYMVDDWLFEESEGLDFRPMSYDPCPDKPAIEMDRPWEYGVMSVKHLSFDETAGHYRMEYGFTPETFRRRAHAWTFLVDDIDAGDGAQPLPWEALERGSERRMVWRPKAQRQFDDELVGHAWGPRPQVEATDSLQVACRKLLWTCLQAGVPVRPFDIPPEGYALAILADPRSRDQRRTDHLALAVPGRGPEAQLPPPEEADLSRAEIYEMFPEDLERPAYICVATSTDGVTWEKPELRRVAFHGSTANNILRTTDEEDRAYLQRAHEADTCAVRPGAAGRPCRFRRYDEDRDGPVNMDMLFMAHFAGGRDEKIDFKVPDDLTDSPSLGFTPEPRAYYPMMYGGARTYLFLSDRPLIHLGSGMDLMHSSESIRCQIERRAGERVTVFWYYRPNAPGYPPHNWPCDNHQGPLRNLAVMWTDDGVSFHKRSCIGPDEFDPPGMQLYSMGVIGRRPGIHDGRTMLRRSSTPGVSVPAGRMVVAELRCYDGARQTQYPELIWTRDLLHWHRFTKHRAPLLRLGTEEGAYNWGMYFQEQSYYPFKDPDGRDAWWLSNTAIGGRHCHRSVGFRHATVQSAQSHYPHYSESPFFVDWPTLFARSQRMHYLPQFTHIRPGRLAFVTPTGAQGSFLTWPIQLEGTTLVLNATCEERGCLRVAVQDGSGAVVPGYGLDECDPLTGDAVRMCPRWGVRSLAALKGRVVRFKVVLDRARLYTLNVEC